MSVTTSALTVSAAYITTLIRNVYKGTQPVDGRLVCLRDRPMSLTYEEHRDLLTIEFGRSILGEGIGCPLTNPQILKLARGEAKLVNAEFPRIEYREEP